jgi:hypothetical protein
MFTAFTSQREFVKTLARVAKQTAQKRVNAANQHVKLGAKFVMPLV